MNTETCDRCGAIFAVGQDWRCPHEPFHGAVKPDDVPGGFTVENAWREPRTFYSQSAYEQALAADGLMLNPHYVPGSRHLTNWAATMDPQTLANAAALVSRQGRTTTAPQVTLESLRMETRALDVTLTVRAES